MRPLSKKIQTLIVAGASTAILLAQFLQEKEGNRLSAYQDGANVWTICRGATRVDGQPVRQGLQLSREKCEQVNKMEVDKAIAWVEQHIKVPVNARRPLFIANSMPVTPSEPVQKLNAGSSMVAKTAVFEPITVRVSLSDAHRKAYSAVGG